MTPPRGSLSVIILAGGTGSRLLGLTRALYGIDLPKQFATLVGERSLLQGTIERAMALVSEEHILVVVSRADEAVARAQLARYPKVELVLQPCSRGTAVGLLLPLARLRARDPHAMALVMPSDHFVVDRARFLDAARHAIRLARRGTDWVVLLGATPDHAETDYGWIVPGRALTSVSGRGAHAVSRFVEKPDQALAAQLYARTGLWNTFVMAARANTLWRLMAEHAPEVMMAFERSQPGLAPGPEAAALEQLWAELPHVDFSRAILERADRLAVVPLARSGWCDWGVPERVFESLRGSPALEQLQARIAAPHDVSWSDSSSHAA